MKYILLISMLLISYPALSNNVITGAITDENLYFPANKKKPTEFMFTLKGKGEYIFLSNDIAATFTDQTIEIRTSDSPKIKNRTVVCEIKVFDIPFEANGVKQILKLEKPQLFKSVKSNGC